MPPLPPLVPLPLADAGDVVKIAIFAVAGLVWVVAQVAAATKSKAKREINRARTELNRDDSERGDAPPVTRLDRQLARRRKQAEQFRETGRRDAPAPPPPASRPQTYEELRQARRQPPAPPVDKPRPPQPKRPAAKKPPVPVVAVAAAVSRSEIGGDAAPGIGKGRRGKSHHSAVAALLRRGSLRDVIAASEILQPPVALRQGNDGSGR